MGPPVDKVPKTVDNLCELWRTCSDNLNRPLYCKNDTPIYRGTVTNSPIYKMRINSAFFCETNAKKSDAFPRIINTAAVDNFFQVTGIYRTKAFFEPNLWGLFSIIQFLSTYPHSLLVRLNPLTIQIRLTRKQGSIP